MSSSSSSWLNPTVTIVGLTSAALAYLAYYIYTNLHRAESGSRPVRSKKKAAKEAKKNRAQFSME